AVLHRHVVVDDDRLDADALVGGEVGGHLEVEHVARVVLDDVQHARAAVGGLGGGEDLVGDGRGEHLAGAGGVEHAVADEAAVQRFVAGAAAGDQADLAGGGAAGSDDVAVLGVDGQRGVGGGDPGQRVGEYVVGGVDELLHGSGSLGCRG